jgi:hypothetical protein
MFGEVLEKGRTTKQEVAATIQQMWDLDKFQDECLSLASYAAAITTATSNALRGRLPKPHDPNDLDTYALARASSHFHYLSVCANDRPQPITFRAARSLPWPSLPRANDDQVADFFAILASRIDRFRSNPNDLIFTQQLHDLFAPLPAHARGLARSLAYDILD